VPPDNPGPRSTRWLRSEKPWDDVMGRGFESPHLHHGSRSLTCSFGHLEYNRAALGPRTVRVGCRAGAFVDLLEAVGERVELVGVEVAVAVQGLHRVLVAEHPVERACRQFIDYRGSCFGRQRRRRAAR
jgi:hypothetical protein